MPRFLKFSIKELRKIEGGGGDSVALLARHCADTLLSSAGEGKGCQPSPCRGSLNRAEQRHITTVKRVASGGIDVTMVLGQVFVVSEG